MLRFLRTLGRGIALASVLALTARAQTIWNPGTSNWGTASNWTAGVPGSATTATFTYKTNKQDPVITGSAAAGKLVFTGSTDSESFTGTGTLSLYGVGGVGIDLQLNRAGSFANAITVAGNQSWNVTNTGGGSITTNGALNLGSFTLTLNPANSVNSFSLNSTVSGAGSLVAAGAGKTYLNANNSYLGTTTVNSGATLQVGSGSTTGTLGAGNVTNNGTLIISRSNAITVANAIGGSGSLRQSGAGMLTLTADNSYTGTTTINTGSTLQVGNGGTSGAVGTGNVVNNGTLIINRSDNVTTANVVSGTGSVTKNGTGTLTVAGNNTYSGATRINSGVLAVGSLANGGAASSIGNAASTANNLIFNGGTLRYTGASAATNRLFSVGTSGGKIDTGTGSLSFTNTGALGFNGQTGNRTLELTGAGTGSLASVLGNNTGTTSLVKSGTGTWTLSGNNTFTGTTTVTGGTLIASNAGALGAASATSSVADGAAIGLAGNITTTFGGTSLTGSGSGGFGALYNVSGTNQFSGTIMIKGDTTIGANAGTLTLSNSINLDSAVAANTTINFKPATGSLINVTGTIADNNNDSYWINVANTGNGTLQLSNAGNTYAGDTIIGTAGGTTTGTIKLGVANALPMPPYYVDVPTIRVYSGTLDLNNLNATALGNLALSGGGAGSTATVKTGTGVLTLTKNLLYSSAYNAQGATVSGNLLLVAGTHEFQIQDSTSAAADVTISATISGSGLIQKTGEGTLVLTGTNTYTGRTIISNGKVVVQNSKALGQSSAPGVSDTSVTAGGTLQLEGFASNLTITDDLRLAGSGFQNAGALQNNTGTNTLTGAVEIAAASTRIQTESGSTLQINGNITGTSPTNPPPVPAPLPPSLEVTGGGTTIIRGDIASSVKGLTKRDAGTLVLYGGNALAGPVNVEGGTLSVRNSAALGADTNAVSVKSGATLAFDNTGAVGNILVTGATGGINLEGSSTTASLRNVAGTNLYSGPVNVATAATIVANTGSSLTIGGALTASNSAATVRIGETGQSGNIILSGGIATNGAALQKNGGGTLTVSGGSVGALQLNSGSLTLDGGTLTANSLIAAGGTSLLIAGGGTISVAGATTIAGGTLNSASSGILQVVGNTTLTFTGSNSATNLTLKVGGTSSGDMTGAIRINLGSSLTVKTIEITGDTILDFNNSAATVLTSTNLIISNPNAKIRVENWVSSTTPSSSDIWYVFGQIGTTQTNGRPLGSTNDTAAPLPQISFNNASPGMNTTWVANTSSGWYSHEIRPTPEPATYGAVLMSACLGLLGWRRLRRQTSAGATTR